MRWWILLPALVATALLDVALMPMLSVAGCTAFTLPILLAFVGFYASRGAALFAALAAGLLLDTAAPSVVPAVGGVDAVPIIGPHMLAWAAAMWAMVETRGLLYRRNALSLAVAAGAMSLASALAFLAIAGVRAAYADPLPLWGQGRAASALGADALNALATAILALLVGWMLQRTLPWWGFATAGQRFGFEGRGTRASG